MHLKAEAEREAGEGEEEPRRRKLERGGGEMRRKLLKAIAGGRGGEAAQVCDPPFA
jgi:hypothetical protein